MHISMLGSVVSAAVLSENHSVKHSFTLPPDTTVGGYNVVDQNSYGVHAQVGRFSDKQISVLRYAQPSAGGDDSPTNYVSDGSCT